MSDMLQSGTFMICYVKFEIAWVICGVCWGEAYGLEDGITPLKCV